MTDKVIIKLKNESGCSLPEYATGGSSGADIRAFLSTAITLLSGERSLIPTGIYAEIPLGYEIQVRPRSGLAVNHGVTCLNTPGTIDADYRGEIKVLLINLGHDTVVISNGDRIAQLVVAKVDQAFFKLVTDINETQRADGGFGHTGIK